MVVNVVRQEFEKWFLDRHGNDYDLSKFGNGEYRYHVVEVAWESWQISHRKTMQGYQ